MGRIVDDTAAEPGLSADIRPGRVAAVHQDGAERLVQGEGRGDGSSILGGVKDGLLFHSRVLARW